MPSSSSPPPQPPPSLVNRDDIEREISRLFGDTSQTGLVIRVYGESGDVGRSEAFRQLLDSLSIYEFGQPGQEIRVKPPDADTITKALVVLGAPRLKRQLFERILVTVGKSIVDPLGEILETRPGALRERMLAMRNSLLAWVEDLRLTYETQQVLGGDLRKALSDEYLTMLAEHEEKVQRPRVTELVQELLHLIGSIFEQAFRQWPSHARTIGASIARRIGSSLSLRESPLVIRERIIEGIQEFLWIETSTELTGAVRQLFMQPQYQGLTAAEPPPVERASYRQFAEACWDIVTHNC